MLCSFIVVWFFINIAVWILSTDICLFILSLFLQFLQLQNTDHINYIIHQSDPDPSSSPQPGVAHGAEAAHGAGSPGEARLHGGQRDGRRSNLHLDVPQAPRHHQARQPKLRSRSDSHDRHLNGGLFTFSWSWPQVGPGRTNKFLKYGSPSGNAINFN